MPDWAHMSGKERARFLHDERRKKLQGPQPLGWCFYCFNHPSKPIKVAAVTKTHDGTPRCGPCGRWRE